MLKRKRYIGVREHKGAEYPAIWKPILTLEQFELVQAVFRANDQLHGRRGNPRKYLLAGYAYCGSCGAKLGGCMKRDRAGEPNKPRYKCLPYDSTGRRTGCAGVSRLAEPLEDFITETVLYRFDSEDFARIFAETAEDSTQLKTLLDEHAAKKAKLSALIDGYYGDNPDDLSREQFMRAKSSAEASLEKAEREVERTTSKRALAGVPIGMTLRDAWQKNESLDWRRSIIGLLIDKIVVNPGGGKPRYKTWRFDTDQIDVSWLV
jgi:site-specific DNA recombinase